MKGGLGKRLERSRNFLGKKKTTLTYRPYSAKQLQKGEREGRRPFQLGKTHDTGSRYPRKKSERLHPLGRSYKEEGQRGGGPGKVSSRGRGFRGESIAETFPVISYRVKGRAKDARGRNY